MEAPAVVEQRLRASLEEIKVGLAGSARNTAEMTRALASFEGRIETLQAAMAPIHDVTQQLARAQRNISGSLAAFEKVHTHFVTARDVGSVLSEPQRLKSRDGAARRRFFDALERVCESHAYLLARENFMSAPGAVRELAELRQHARDAVEVELELLLEKHGATPEDYAEAGLMEWPPPAAAAEGPQRMHEQVDNDAAVLMQELSRCLVRCNLSALLVELYCNTRGTVVRSVLDVALNKAFPAVAGSPSGRSAPNSFWDPASGAPPPPPAPPAPPAPPPRVELLSAPDDYAANDSDIAGASVLGSLLTGRRDDDCESLASTSSQRSFGKPKKRGWRSRIRSKLTSSGADAAGRNRPFLPPSPRAGPVTAPEPPASFAAPSMPKKSISSFGLRLPRGQSFSQLNETPRAAPPRSPAPTPGNPTVLRRRGSKGVAPAAPPVTQRRYKEGTHPMLPLLALAAQVLRAEMILASRSLPGGRTGRKVFLQAMQGPAEAFSRVARSRALSWGREEYGDMEAPFALLDVVERLEAVRDALEDALAPDSLVYLSFMGAEVPASPREGGSRPTSPRSAKELPNAAWHEVDILMRAWHGEARNSLGRAKNALLQPPQALPSDAGVQRGAALLVSFLRRAAKNGDRLGQLLAKEDTRRWDEASAERRARLRAFVESVLLGYHEVLFELPETLGRDQGTQVLFMVNNLKYVLDACEADEALSEVLDGSAVVAQLHEELQTAKENYLGAVTRGPLGACAQAAALGTSGDKKTRKEALGAVVSAIEAMHRQNVGLAVADFELRTELRLRVRAAVVPVYKDLIETAGLHGQDEVQLQPAELVSAMVSQFFEVSETSSNPNALASPANDSPTKRLASTRRL